MFEVVSKQTLAPKVTRYVVRAPDIAKARKAGQFVMVRVGNQSERIPLTIADADPQAGTITLVVQEVGKSTAIMSTIAVGDAFHDVVGPLGSPTHIEKKGLVVCVGGGIGIAPVHPIAQAHKAVGNEVISILGARTKELLIMEAELRAASSEVLICTDDGSYGEKALVTQVLERLIKERGKPAEVIAIGPPIMMKFVAATTLPYEIPTQVSLNSVMVDGTGMCGGCRVTVGGETKFVCVDGPEFDGHAVDFDEMMRRQQFYADQEKLAYEAYLAGRAAQGA
ncbi:MAG: sulfide/dihydroorotate dehydrogenase-like FAD/NAD-binding protein [Deltaproteobacteria bacterium]|nr:sulfide/dihydroorotate dehydrogenase-like FAD/NAD-binding protein [Deltaproteobacteria bacterium]